MIGNQQSADIAANTQIATGNNRILSGAVLAAAAVAATLIIYDNTAASGKVIGRLSAAANGNSAFLGPIQVPVGIGIYAAITGAGAAATIYFE